MGEGERAPSDEEGVRREARRRQATMGCIWLGGTSGEKERKNKMNSKKGK